MHSQDTHSLSTLVLASLAAGGLALGCAAEIGDATEETPLESVELDSAFAAAAAEFDVPAALLKAISYTETRWQMVVGHEEHEGRPRVIGLMGLRSDQLSKASTLTGFDQADFELDEKAGIFGAAALLSELANEHDFDRSDLDAWAQIVGEYSGIADQEARHDYVVGTVYEVLARGEAKIDEAGTTTIDLGAHEVAPDYPAATTSILAGTSDYPAAVWRPSPNNNARPSGTAGKPQLVIIHTCEGGYAGCWGWLKNKASGVSAHYVIKENGKEITQLVRESRRAWHIGAKYKSSLNSGRLSGLNGSSSNNFTIGIEHAGFASQSSFPTGQIEASAKLVCNITKDRNIARDKYHIVGHGKLQPYNRTDPGKNWPWTHYINRVKSHCGSTSTPPSSGSTIVVDSNNSRNNSAKARIEVSSKWKASNSTKGFYGTGYWYAETDPVADGASFWFYLPKAGTKKIDAWWTAGTNRSSSAAFVAFNASGKKLGTGVANQQTSGKRWNNVGSYAFSKGWNRVVLSRWSNDNKVVIADALRVR